MTINFVIEGEFRRQDSVSTKAAAIVSPDNDVDSGPPTYYEPQSILRPSDQELDSYRLQSGRSLADPSHSTPYELGLFFLSDDADELSDPET